jgi:hypothetical protein
MSDEIHITVIEYVESQVIAATEGIKGDPGPRGERGLQGEVGPQGPPAQNVDGGSPTSVYGGLTPIDGGTP